MDHLNLKGKWSLFENLVTNTQAPDMLGDAQTDYHSAALHVHFVGQLCGDYESHIISNNLQNICTGPLRMIRW